MTTPLPAARPGRWLLPFNTTLAAADERHLIADLSDKQALLAQPDALRRLTSERALLSRENAMLRSLTSTPTPELRYTPYSPN